MAIELKPEQEQVIGLAIQAGLIHRVDEVLEVGVETIRQRLEARMAPANNMDTEEWSRELHDWIHGHATTIPPLSDDAISRESIYGSRGL
ncbi:MAG TPA: hypothetical protein VGN16_23880 [Acidobacteriaceae bacterium]|jgi:hypothetical protein